MYSSVLHLARASGEQINVTVMVTSTERLWYALYVTSLDGELAAFEASVSASACEIDKHIPGAICSVAINVTDRARARRRLLASSSVLSVDVARSVPFDNQTVPAGNLGAFTTERLVDPPSFNLTHKAFNVTLLSEELLALRASAEILAVTSTDQLATSVSNATLLRQTVAAYLPQSTFTIIALSPPPPILPPASPPPAQPPPVSPPPESPPLPASPLPPAFPTPPSPPSLRLPVPPPAFSSAPPLDFIGVTNQSLTTTSDSSSMLGMAAGAGAGCIVLVAACFLWRSRARGQRQQKQRHFLAASSKNMLGVCSDEAQSAVGSSNRAKNMPKDKAKLPRRASSAHRVETFIHARANMMNRLSQMAGRNSSAGYLDDDSERGDDELDYSREASSTSLAVVKNQGSMHLDAPLSRNSKTATVRFHVGAEASSPRRVGDFCVGAKVAPAGGKRTGSRSAQKRTLLSRLRGLLPGSAPLQTIPADPLNNPGQMYRSASGRSVMRGPPSGSSSSAMCDVRRPRDGLSTPSNAGHYRSTSGHTIIRGASSGSSLGSAPTSTPRRWDAGGSGPGSRANLALSHQVSSPKLNSLQSSAI